jgi:undecaprenyl diphosphate synthase
MIHWFYERRLKKALSLFPQHVCFMISEQEMRDAPGKVIEVATWCRDLGIGEVTFHIDTRDPEKMEPYLAKLHKIAEFAKLTLHYAEREEVSGEGMNVIIAVGMSGREEVARCIRSLASEGVSPEKVTEEMIESHLTFQYEPDLVVKTGGNYLTDFLIWQSVYSELLFSDVNWKLFRKIDFLRALRDYQFRKRRFGK